MSVLLGLLPWRWIAAVLLTVGAAFAIEWHGDRHGRAAVQAAWDAERAAAAAQHAADEAELRRFEAARQRNITGALDAQTIREARARADAAGARNELERLRSALAALPATQAAADPGAAGQPGDAATFRELFGACSERHADVAGAAEPLRLQVIGLQQWVAAACVVAPTEETTP